MTSASTALGRVDGRRGGCRSEGVAGAGGFRLSAGASVSTMAPFPTVAHRTGLAAFPHPALGRVSRVDMHEAFRRTLLVNVDHSQLAMDLGVSEPTTPSDT